MKPWARGQSEETKDLEKAIKERQAADFAASKEKSLAKRAAKLAKRAAKEAS